MLNAGTAPLTVLHLDFERGWRGGQQQVAYLIEYLGALGVRNLLAARRGEPLAKLALSKSWPLVEVGSPWLDAGRVSRVVRQEHVSIVHAHTARAQNLGLALRMVQSNLRLVVARRVDFHRRSGLVSKWKYGTALVERWIAVSKRVREVLIEDGVPADRIAVVYDGVDPARFRGPALPAAEMRAEFGLKQGEFVVGNVGALVGHKDQATLVRAAALALERLPHLRVVIAGEGELRPDLERLIASLGLEGRVRLLGHSSRLRELYATLDLFAMSSRTEGLGTSVLDAMAVGCPVVVTAAGGLPEVVQGDRNGLVVPPENPEALAEAMVRMARDEAFRRRCGAQNIVDVERFSAALTAENTLRLYRELG